MLRKYLIAAGLSAAALGAAIPSAASAQYYGYDNGPRTSFSVSIGSGYNPGYYGGGYGYYDRGYSYARPGYGYYGRGNYDRRDWRHERREHRRDWRRDRDRRW